jgi:CheY-like chemotaxis protein
MRTPLHGIQVLLVEDEPDIAELLTFVLTDAGADVIQGSSAFEALQKLDQGLPDVLVCSLRLPDMDAGQLLRCIRDYKTESGRPLPAIAMTSYTREFTFTEITEAGFDRFLPKPLSQSNSLQRFSN